MEDRFFCAVKRRKVEDVDCAGIICQADASCIAVCRTCERGKALASTAKRAVENAVQAAHLERDDAPPPPALSAWEKIQRATGCASYGQLAKLTGYADTVLRNQIARLQEGKLPRRDNGVVPAILRAAKLTLQDLIPGAPHIEFVPSTHSSSQRAELLDETPPAPAVPSSPPQPSGPVSSSAGPEGGLEGEAASESPLDAYDAAGKAMGLEVPAHLMPSAVFDRSTGKLTLMGAEPFKQLMRREDVDALRKQFEADQFAADSSAPAGKAMGLEVPMPSAAFVSSAGKLLLMGAEPSEQLMRREDVDALRERCGSFPPPAIPPDFIPYTGDARSKAPLSLSFMRTGEIGISSGAVQAFGLQNVERVQLFWSPQRSQVGICPGDGPGARKLQRDSGGRMGRSITARAFLREFGLSPAPGPHPVTRDPSGLIVATISQQPSQGGEA